jgi:hypothetical protein
LADLRDTLMVRADSGDIEAARRLAHDAVRCVNAAYETDRMQDNLEGPDVAAKTAAIRNTLSAVCHGMGREEIFSLSRHAVLRAAELGDVDSQLCALTLRFTNPHHSAEGNLSEEESAQLASAAANYEASAFARGDWRIAQFRALQTQTSGHGRIGGRIAPVSSDPLTLYRMERLLRLGAVGDYAQYLDEQIDRVLNESSSQGMDLSPQAIKEADAWAFAQYQNIFSASPTLESAPRLCDDF